jgi:hypothetical protein
LDKTSRNSTLRNFLHTYVLLLSQAEKIQRNLRPFPRLALKKKKPPLRDIEQFLQIDNVLPFIILDFVAVELLQGVNTQSGDLRIQRVCLLKLPAVQRLIWPFKLDSDRGLSCFAIWNFLVITFDGGTKRKRLANDALLGQLKLTLCPDGELDSALLQDRV